MSRIRRFMKADIPEVVALYARALPDGGTPSAAYYEEVFLNNPWADESISSLVYEHDDGKIRAFLGVVPRRFWFQRQTIQGAVASQLMVDPSYRSSMAGVQLLRTLIAGPQDVSLADLSNRAGREVWTLLRADTVWFYSLRWSRVLRSSSARRMQRVLARLGPLARRVCSAVEARRERMRRAHLPPDAPRHTTESIHDTDIITHIGDVAGGAYLRPQYDSASLKWILARAAKKTRFGSLQQIGVRNEAQDLIGWYFYYAQPHGHCRVLQVAARGNYMGDVLDSLFSHAFAQGAVSLFGRLEPHLANALAGKSGIGYYREESWLMVHARNAELLSRVHRGDAFLTELDGERMIGCVGEEPA